jgi:high frequency lysogenization protein
MADPIQSNGPNKKQERSQERGLALAALLFTAAMVDREAQGAPLSPQLVDYLLTPVLARNSDSVSQLLPATQPRQQLLAQAKQLIRGDANSVTILGYVVELIELAKRLGNHPAAAKALGEQLDTLQHPNPEQLASIYQNSISHLGRRIQVRGDPQALQSEAVAAKVRALLLAGVRYAWLWQQLGGRRWQLIIQRNQILATLTELEREPSV